MKKLFLLTALCGLFFSACKKYPDGPSFSLRSAEQRITGVWMLTSYTVDDVDSINIFSPYTDIPSLDLSDPTLSDSAGYIIRGGMDTTNYVSNIGTFQLTEKKMKLVLTSTKKVNQLNFYSPLITSETVTYEILRLKKKELWLRTSFDGRNYELKYEK